MKYELAKELYDAGFPQGGKGSWTYPSNNLVTRSSDRVYVPALSELIEACGNNFTQLRHWAIKWSAYAALNIDREIKSLDGMGDTPKEAVARLWLVLQNE